MRHASRLASRQLHLLFVVALAYWTTSQMIRPLVSMFLVSLGASPGVVGLVVSMQSLVPLFLAVPAGGLADRFGHRRFLVFGSLGMVGTGLLYVAAGISRTYPALVVAQIIEGICELLVWTSAQAYVTQLGNDDDRDRNIGYFSLFSAAGQMAGPTVGGFAAEAWGYRAAFGVFAVMCLSLVVAVLMLPDNRLAAPARETSIGSGQGMFSASKRICANPEVQVGMIGTFANLFITGMWSSFYPIYVVSMGFTPSVAGMLVGLKGLAALAVRPFLAPVTRRLGRPGALIAATGAAILPVAVTPVLRSFVLLALAAAVSGAGLGLNLPLTIAIMAHNTVPEERGVAMGLRLVMNRIALLTNPLIFGFVSEYTGFELSFYVCSGFVVLLIIPAVRRWRAASTVRQA